MIGKADVFVEFGDRDFDADFWHGQGIVQGQGVGGRALEWAGAVVPSMSLLLAERLCLAIRHPVGPLRSAATAARGPEARRARGARVIRTASGQGAAAEIT